MRPHGLRAALLALLMLQMAVADPTTALMSQLDSGVDPPDCGDIGKACCLRASQKCVSAQLVCASVNGPQSQQCTSCGEDTQPVCANGGCNDNTLQAFELPGRNYRTCLFVPQRVAPALANVDPNPTGPIKDRARRMRLEKLRKDDDLGRQMRGVGCGLPGSTVTCRGKSYCQSGVCIRCGIKDRPCCPTGNPCRDLQGRRAGLQCVDETSVPNGSGTKMCRLVSSK